MQIAAVRYGVVPAQVFPVVLRGPHEAGGRIGPIPKHLGLLCGTLALRRGLSDGEPDGGSQENYDRPTDGSVFRDFHVGDFIVRLVSNVDDYDTFPTDPTPRSPAYSLGCRAKRSKLIRLQHGVIENEFIRIAEYIEGNAIR